MSSYISVSSAEVLSALIFVEHTIHYMQMQKISDFI